MRSSSLAKKLFRNFWQVKYIYLTVLDCCPKNRNLSKWQNALETGSFADFIENWKTGTLQIFL